MGSAVDTLTTGSGAITPPAAPKRNAVAHETPVDVTGAKPGLDSGKRELFAESTNSVLVFENGGVIRLAADVTPGQLLFLTHAATKREVVAQVTRKHALGSGYVEVEFTEPAPGFWDVTFPSQMEAAQTRRAESAPAAALREAVEKADQETPAAPSSPDLAEVERLKSEVEALREQLESIKRQPAASPQPDASVPAPPWVIKKAKEEALGAEQAQMAGQLAKAKESAAVAEPATEMAQPEREFAAQDLLPKAALDFSRADALNATTAQSPVANVPTVNLQALAPSRSSPGKLRLALLAVLLLAVLGAAWYQGWIPGVTRGKPQAVTAAAPARPMPAKPVAGGNTQKTAPPAASQAGPSPQTLAAGNAVSMPTAADAPPDNTGRKDSGAESNSEKSPQSASPDEELPAPPASSRTTARSAKVGSAPEKNPKKALDAEVSPVSENEEGIVPPKLVHSVRAVPPPEAARNFATGNVILDAIVDAAGQVQSSKVLSGPASLRSAAINAVKQYQYTPARKHGKAVPAHVQVTVQFWYEP